MTAGMGWNTGCAQEDRHGARSQTFSEQRQGVKSNKGWEWGWGNKPTSQSRVLVDRWASLWDWGWYSKLNCPTLLEEELTSQSCSCRATQLLPGGTTSDLTTLQELAVSYLRSQLHAALWKEEPNIAHKPVTRWDHFRVPIAMNTPKDQEMCGGEKHQQYPPQAVWQKGQHTSPQST
jgi:hypothetical protein